MLIYGLNQVFGEVLSKVPLNFRYLSSSQNLRRFLNRLRFLFCLKLFLHISLFPANHLFRPTYFTFFILYHFHETALWVILCDLLYLLVDLDCHRVLLMVVSFVQDVVPGEGVVEPDIENLVTFLEFFCDIVVA